MDDLSMGENFDESRNDKKSSDSESSFTSKRKQKNDTKFTNFATKKTKRDSEARISSQQVDLPSFTGKRFENLNGNNICYINAVLNSLLALDKFRKKLNEGSCQCELCKFLTSTNLNAINLRIWTSRFNPVFNVHGRHEDAEMLRNSSGF